MVCTVILIDVIISYRSVGRAMILDRNEPYKLEILGDIGQDGTPISLYHVNKPTERGSNENPDGPHWWDLCAGPHVAHTGELDGQAFELTSIAGAYWKGDEANTMLTRVYGTYWNNKEELASYKQFLEDSKARDHRLLGAKHSLFVINSESAGGGMVFWLPKGATIRRAIEDFWKDEHIRHGYQLVNTPHIAHLNLWKTSGHADFYKDDMFSPIVVQDQNPQLYQLKPMNCPFHCLVYKGGANGVALGVEGGPGSGGIKRSYKELPIRYAELGTVYRYERSGALHGLFRVRGFTQDDAHIFCLPSQLTVEIVSTLSLTFGILNKFHFNTYEVMLSTRPKDSIGSDSDWNKATEALKSAMDATGTTYAVDDGGGAFYGPKIDIKIRDALGRFWQCSTIQVDFNLPARFDLQYHDSEQQVQRPIMIHRAIFGSLERFFGIMIESTAANFPLWLAPVQCRIMCITDDVKDYGDTVERALKAAGVRVELRTQKDRITKQIKQAEEEKIPFQLILGRAEKETGSVSIRYHGVGNVPPGPQVSVPLDQTVGLIVQSISKSSTAPYVEPTPENSEEYWQGILSPA